MYPCMFLGLLGINRHSHCFFVLLFSICFWFQGKHCHQHKQNNRDESMQTVHVSVCVDTKFRNSVGISDSFE